jgi:hypothetical protein
MILRKITQAFKEQNWTAIWIEFILLIAGVFLGIQVANWNEARTERALEQVYLAQLAEDIRSESSEMDGIIQSSFWGYATTEDFVEAASGVKQPRTYTSRIRTIKMPARTENDIGEDTDVGLSMLVLSTLDGSRSTYNTMISTGGIRLLSDKNLLVHIQQYYARVDEVRDFERVLLQHRTEYIQAQHRAGLSATDLPSKESVVQYMQKNPELLATAKTYRMLIAYHVLLMTDLRGRGQALLDDLQRTAKAMQ